MAGVERGFLDWMVFGVPSALALFPVGWFLLLRMFPPEMEMLDKMPLAESDLEKSRMSLAEWTTLTVFLVVVALWIATPFLEDAYNLDLPVEYVIFAGVLVFFIPKLDVLNWGEIHRECSWNALLLMMTGLAIGYVVSDSGIAEWVSYLVLQRFGALPLYAMIVATALTVSILHNLFASNTITCVVMVPIILHTAIVMGRRPGLPSHRPRFYRPWV